MTNKFTDDIPAIGNSIVSDYDLMQRSLGYLKNSFQAICNDWGDTGADLKVNNVYSDSTFNDVTKHYEKITFNSSLTESVTSLDENGLYRINLVLYSTLLLPVIQFNSDTDTNYTYGYQYSGQITNTDSHTSAQAEGESGIILSVSAVSGFAIMDIIFGSEPGNTDNTILNSKFGAYQSATEYHETSVVGFYAGSSALTSVTITIGAAATGTGAIERIA
jgi:hypothetical protein